jgi:hypothetical protein
MEYIDKQNAAYIRKYLEKSLWMVSKKLDLNIAIGCINYDTLEAKTTLTITVKKQGDRLVYMGQKDFDFVRNMEQLGIRLGDTFTYPSLGVVQLIAYKHKNRKYPIIVRDRRGKSYKISIQKLKDLAF